MDKSLSNDANEILPYKNDDKKVVQVEHMFDAIAPKYDSLNHTLSMGIDRAWRRKGILELEDLHPEQILDVATGTGDLAIFAHKLLNTKHILGIDISEGMMNVGRQKVCSMGLSDVISFEKQDCCQLSLSDNYFDAAMVAFGVRNFENLDASLQEILRVLRPGGRLMILELSSPKNFYIRQLYTIYSKLIIPFVGRLVSNNKAAYSYLPKSVKAFYQGKDMVDILTKNGFVDAQYQTFTFGICSMYLGTKK
ncbi:ubiquinone/menaquinone biosynthesis methyltransferase [Bacteroidales bacterium]|nr:ubiquinone/menaquinone biosynthesis methyltransferase [Bacteroidales bacterium]